MSGAGAIAQASPAPRALIRRSCFFLPPVAAGCGCRVAVVACCCIFCARAFCTAFCCDRPSPRACFMSDSTSLSSREAERSTSGIARCGRGTAERSTCARSRERLPLASGCPLGDGVGAARRNTHCVRSVSASPRNNDTSPASTSLPMTMCSRTSAPCSPTSAATYHAVQEFTKRTGQERTTPVPAPRSH